MFLQMEDGSWMVRRIGTTYFDCCPLLLNVFLMVVCLDYIAVFHVTDQNGEKLTDESVIRYLEQVI